MLALSASSIDCIFESIGQVGARLGLDDRARAVVARESARLLAVRERTKDLRHPTVVMLEWTDPLFANMGNWGPELVEIAGGDLVSGSKGEYSTILPAEKLIAADPEYLIVAPCGFNLDRALQERDVLAKHAWWSQLRAVREGKVAFADGNLFFNRSGMTVAPTAEIIAEILHGEAFGAPTLNKHWQWIGDPQ
jgi:iron complex transport system substrate-binding protein